MQQNLDREGALCGALDLGIGTEHIAGLRHITQTQDANAVEIRKALLQSLHSAGLGTADWLTRVIVLLIRLVISLPNGNASLLVWITWGRWGTKGTAARRGLRCLGVADLSLEVAAVLGLVFLDARPVGPLGVSVNVHLNYAVLDRLLDVLDLTWRKVSQRGHQLRTGSERYVQFKKGLHRKDLTIGAREKRSVCAHQGVECGRRVVVLGKKCWTSVGQEDRPREEESL